MIAPPENGASRGPGKGHSSQLSDAGSGDERNDSAEAGRPQADRTACDSTYSKAQPVSAVGTHALDCAGIGWHVFPCGRNKKPLISRDEGGNGYLDATTDPGQIREWWSRWPDAQIGVACGASGLVVVDLDLDRAGGKNGRRALEQRLGPNGRHGALLEASTPRGGAHLFYADPDHKFGIGTHVLGLGSGVDVRGVGGYVIVPDGQNGREWANGDDPLKHLELCPPPPVIAEFLPVAGVGTARKGRGKMKPAGTAAEDKLAKVHSALLALDPSMKRDNWLRLIFAAHAALDGDERGADLVEEWSSQTTVPGQYQAGEATGTYSSAVLPWESKSAAPLVDEGTLFYMAQEAGWKWDRGTAADAELQQLIAAQPATPTPTPTVSTDSTFPMDLLEGDGLLQRMVRHIVDSAHIPQPMFALGATLATLGAVLGRRVQLVNRRGAKLRTNIYTIAIGKTGCGKDWAKSESLALLRKAGLSKLIGERAYKSDSAIIAHLQEHPALVAHLDEFGLTLQSTSGSRAPAHLRGINQTLLELYSWATGTMPGDGYANRKDRPPVELVEPSLSFCGYTTPETLVAALSSGDVSSGLLGRCLPFEEMPGAREREGQDFVDGDEQNEVVDVSADLHALSARLDELVPPVELDLGGESPPNVRSLTCTRGAADYLDGLIDVKRGLSSGRFGGIWVRLIEQTKKVALIYAVANKPDIDRIDVEHLQWAHRLVRWSIGRLEALLRAHLADSEVEGKTKRVLDLIVKAGAAGMTASELTRRTQWLGRNERKDVIATLIEGGDVHAEQIDPDREDGKGRPTTTYRATGGTA